MAASDTLRTLLDRLLAAPHPPGPRSGRGQLPWHDPDFSERMLRVHLDPTTHMASRAPEIIERHLDWLLAQLAGVGHGGPAHVLDVGCGPGLYLHALARRGHRGTGFDYAPAPLAWARRRAREESLAATFLDADLTDPQQIAPDGGDGAFGLVAGRDELDAQVGARVVGDPAVRCLLRCFGAGRRRPDAGVRWRG